jgi:pyruvate dehydrogenase E1 component beta subunit
MATKLYREAIREALIEELDRNPRVFLMGEDIGRYQGTFRVTEGLFQRYGPKRVWDTPISEPGFIAIAIGAAIEGLKPVVEVMTWSFALLAFDQIVNHAAKILYKSGGACAVPMVIRGPAGPGKQLAAQHSHSLEAWLAHSPGLKVVLPSTPADAKGLLKTAIRDQQPRDGHRTPAPVPDQRRSARRRLHYPVRRGRCEACGARCDDHHLLARGCSSR